MNCVFNATEDSSNMKIETRFIEESNSMHCLTFLLLNRKPNVKRSVCTHLNRLLKRCFTDSSINTSGSGKMLSEFTLLETCVATCTRRNRKLDPKNERLSEHCLSRPAIKSGACALCNRMAIVQIRIVKLYAQPLRYARFPSHSLLGMHVRDI